jgi:hypothetical protein
MLGSLESEMVARSNIYHGVVEGKTIQLEHDTGLPSGQRVTVIVQIDPEALEPGEGLRRSFGGWLEDGAELEQFLEWNRSRRKLSREDIK